MGIARSSKRLKLRSESSARFERGIDPDGVARNAERAMELLSDVAGAAVSPDAEDAYPNPVERQRITVRTSRVNAVLGTTLDAEDVWDALAPLEIELDQASAADTLLATVPTFRPDLEREIDLVEEVARRIGFDRIGRTVPSTRRAKSAHSRRASVTGGRWPTRSWGSDCRRRSPCRSCRLRTSSVLARRSSASCARPTRCAPRSRYCARGSSQASCARLPTTGRTVCTTSRCSSRGTCSTHRPPDRARCPRSPSTWRSRWREGCGDARSRTTGPSTSMTRSTRSTRSLTRSRSTTWCSSRATSTGTDLVVPRGGRRRIRHRRGR